LPSKARKWTLAGALVLLLAAGGGGAFELRAIVRHRNLDRARRDGMHAYEKGQYAAAMEGLGRYVGHHNDDWEGIFALADSRRRVPQENFKHVVTALVYARAAHQAAPNQPRPLELMMELARQLGFQTELRDASERLLALKPDHLEALLARVHSFAATGNLQRALGCAKETAEKHPESTEAHEAVIRLYQLLGLDTDAHDYVEDIARKHSELLSFSLLHTRTAALLHDSEGAIAACRHAATMRPTSKGEFGDLLRYLRAFGLTNEAQDLIAWAKDQPLFASEAEAVTAELAWKAGDEVPALSQLPEKLALLSESELSIRAVLKREDRPRIAAELAIRTTPLATYWTQILTGLTALETKEFANGETALKAAAALNPMYGYAQFFLGDAYAGAGSWRRAAELYAEAGRSDPAWRSARSAAMVLLVENGEIDRGREAALDAFLTTRQFGDGLLLARASVLLLESHKAGEQVGAQTLALLDVLENAAPNVPSVTALRARALFSLDRRDEVVAAIEQLLALPKSAPIESLIRLIVALQPSNAALAARLEEALQKTSPDPSDVAALRAASLVAAGRLPEASAVLAAAIESATDQRRLGLRLVRARLLDQTRDPGAKDVLSELASSNPTNAGTQLAVLESNSAWSDRALIDSTLDRLAALLGKDSQTWKLFDARRLLVFSPGPASAARAIASLSDLVKEDPGNSLAAFLLTDAYLMLEDREHAIDCLVRAANAAPENTTVQLQLIDLLQRAGRSPEAAPRLATVKLARGLSSDILRQRARLFEAQGMRDEATADLAELAGRGQPLDRLSYAMRCADAGDIATARTAVESLRRDLPSDERILIAASRFFERLDGPDAALTLLTGAPTQSDAIRRERASIMERKGDVAGAEQAFTERLRQGGTAGATADLVRFYLRTGSIAKARECVEQAIAQWPTDAGLLWLRSGVRALSKAAPGPATDQLAAAYSTLDPTPDLQLIAEAQLKHGQPNDATGLIAALADVTRKYPTSMMAWRELARAQAAAGDMDAAVRTAGAAFAALPGDARAAQLAALYLAASGRNAQARGVAQRWRELAPSEAIEADIFCAGIDCSEGKFAQASKLLEPWTAQISTPAAPPERVDLLGLAWAGSGRAEQAIRLLTPDDLPGPWLLRAFRIGEALASDRTAARGWLTRFEPVKELAPDAALAAAQAWYKLAEHGRSAEDIQRVTRYAGLAVSAPLLRVSALALSASAYELAGDTQAAIRDYRAALESVPDDWTLLNNLAYALALQSGSEEAVTIASKAMEIAKRLNLPASVRKSLYETLGYAQLRATHFTEAELAYEAGLKLDPTSVDLLVGLAETKIALGKASEAAAVLGQLDARRLPSEALTPAMRTRLDAARQALAPKGAQS
jgi:tetratricopeptide (TPR) repeat protein